MINLHFSKKSSFRLTLAFVLFANVNNAYAIPPPETLLLVGGGLVAPFLLLIGMLTVSAKYLWTKTKLALFWRRYLPAIFIVITLVSILINPVLFQPFVFQNHPIAIQTANAWLHSTEPPLFIDVREKKYYDKIHLLGAINFPQGKGLNTFWRNHPHQVIILYCGIGLTSGKNMRWLYTDKQLLKQALKEKRLFYFPLGISELINMGDKNPFSFVINLTSVYANYLLQQPNYIEMKVNSTDALAEQYQALIANHQIPIINSPLPSEQLANDLSQLKLKQIIFTNLNNENTPDHFNFIFISFLLFAVVLLFLIRRREFFRSMLFKFSNAYQYLSFVISLLAALACIPFAAQFPIDFDLYLFSLHVQLPMDKRYFVFIFLLLGFALFLHFEFPGKKRLDFLRHQLNRRFTHAKDHGLPVMQKPLKNGFIVFCILIGIYIIQPPLASLLIVGVFLMSQLVIDLLLYFGYVYRLKNTAHSSIKLLKKCGYPSSEKGETALTLDSYCESSLAVITATLGQQFFRLGLFSGASSTSHCEKSLTAHDQKFYCELMRNLLLCFQQDLKVNLSKENKIISINLADNYQSARAINRQLLLEHYQRLPSTITDKRFSSSQFQEVFANPTPLSLDILKTNWQKGGGYLKALKKLSFLIKVNHQTADQFLVLSNRIYLDKTFEEALFSANKIHHLIRKKLRDFSCQLALENIIQDYYTLILPKAQLRLKSLHDHLAKPQSVKKLQAIVNRALSQLCKESAQWQYYCSLLHQYAFNQLQKEALQTGQDLTSLIHSARELFKLPSYYDLTLQNTAFKDKKEDYQTVFLTTETYRSDLRELQLKEWQLISLLLEKLRLALDLPLSLAYLTLDELKHLPSDHEKLLARLNDRYEHWTIQNQWIFPSSFSLKDLEQPPQEALRKQKSEAFETIRVAGNQPKIIGNALIFDPKMSLANLPRNSILIADNLTAEQIINCQHIRGILLAQGSYLSHPSIVAREKNIPLVAQVAIDKIKPNERLVILGNKINRLGNDGLAWRFLEEVAEDQHVGNKAQRLAIMQQNGFKIPETIVLEHRSIEEICQSALQDAQNNDGYLEGLSQLIKLFAPAQLPLIVRSSTNIEDSHDFSYAGLFYSQKEIKDVASLLNAILTAWKQVKNSTELVKQYSGLNTSIHLNLILQQYIYGSCGGVLFTQSALPGLMQAEISLNGVESVVQGIKPFTSLYLDKKGQPINACGKKMLSIKQYQALYQLGHQIAVLFGRPQDIEWIMVNGQFYVVQSRDITSQFKKN